MLYLATIINIQSYDRPTDSKHSQIYIAIRNTMGEYSLHVQHVAVSIPQRVHCVPTV